MLSLAALPFRQRRQSSLQSPVNFVYQLWSTSETSSRKLRGGSKDLLSSLILPILQAGRPQIGKKFVQSQTSNLVLFFGTVGKFNFLAIFDPILQNVEHFLC
mmetsp:Transcript_57716/g.151877  ORF Transcript_57716/g.151877 Transcript_57716/m.151877 type:complete len:102 (-) Transcript_57716:408-713(-)